MEAFYLDGKAGQLLCVFRPAEGAPEIRRGVVMIPPFAEEFNMARHTYGRLARALAVAGIGAMTIDPFSTGDSAGDFQDGRWSIWRSDVLAAIDWLRDRGYDKVDILGLRLGGLLAMDIASAHSDRIDRVILWNPVANGRTHINQFLRQRTLSNLGNRDQDQESVNSLRALLDDGEPVNVIGYQLTPDLVADLDALQLGELGSGHDTPVEWFEAVSEGATDFPPGAGRVLETWRSDGVRVTAHPVVDKTFWAMPGIEPHCGDRLIAATVKAMA